MYILMCILLKGISKKNKDLIKYIIIGIGIEIILLIIYRLNLNLIGREVYFSDAETYWNKTLELIKYGKTSGYNSLYYEMCFLIQKTSPFIWVGWNNIFNISCINMSLAIILKVLLKKQENISNAKWLIISVMYNPFIIYGLMRNLKDALFMLMVFIVIYLYYALYQTKKPMIKMIILTTIILFSYLFVMIRPWGFSISICAFVLYIIDVMTGKFNNQKNKNNKKKLIYLLIGTILILPIIYYIYPTIRLNIKVWYPIVKKSFLSKNIIIILSGTMKFILAPGPVRSILGAKYFKYYTQSGNIMCCIGSIMWWLSIILMLTNLFFQKKPIKKIFENAFSKILLLITIMYMAVYIIQYGGVAEIRLRSTLYVFVYALFYSTFDIKKYKNNKISYVLFTFFSIIVFLVATIIGMK